MPNMHLFGGTISGGIKKFIPKAQKGIGKEGQEYEIS